MTGFFEQVYQIVAEIPEQKVLTYGQIAALLGNPRAARVVGWAMRATPEGRNLPWHRVVNRSGGLSALCREEQFARLAAEGVQFTADGRVDLDQYGWEITIAG
jgi:methylated-DNA-protein-cysteine methyltransferase-like protein